MTQELLTKDKTDELIMQEYRKFGQTVGFIDYLFVKKDLLITDEKLAEVLMYYIGDTDRFVQVLQDNEHIGYVDNKIIYDLNTDERIGRVINYIPYDNNERLCRRDWDLYDIENDLFLTYW